MPPSSRSNDRRYVSESEAEGGFILLEMEKPGEALRRKERSYTQGSTLDDEGRCLVPHSVQLSINTVAPDCLHSMLSTLQSDIPGSECLEYVLCDYHGILGSVQTLKHGSTLYTPVSHVSDSASKECFMAMLQHCEETRSAQYLIACIERVTSERPKLVRTLMFMGFKAVTFVKYPDMVPKNTKFIFMMYRIFNDPVIPKSTVTAESCDVKSTVI